MVIIVEASAAWLLAASACVRATQLQDYVATRLQAPKLCENEAGYNTLC